MTLLSKTVWVSIMHEFFIRIDIRGCQEALNILKGKYITSTIPEYSIHYKKPKIENGNIIIKIDKLGNSVNFNLTSNQIEIIIPLEKFLIDDLIYIVFLLFVKILQEESIFLVHSSCVSRKDKGILLIGPSESGKSTVSLHLCLKEGYSLVSTDMTILKVQNDKLVVIGGTKGCSLFPGIIKKEFSSEKKKLFNISDHNLWSSKIPINESRLRELDIQFEKKTKLKHIFFLRVQDTEFFAKPIEDVAAKIKTLGFLSEWIRGANNMLIGLNSLIPSFDSTKSEAKRLNALSVITANTRQYSLYGNLDKITDFIKKECN